MNRSHRLVAIVPALNEALSIGAVVSSLLALRRGDGGPLFEAVVVGDNGSTDGTGEVATAAGALVAVAGQRGYGHGCVAATRLAAARISAIDAYVFVDGDHTTRYEEIHGLVRALQSGNDLVIGRRVTRAPGSMTWAQQFGNHLCSGLVRVLWRVPVHDLGPLRAINKTLYDRLNMEALTFGWTLEMQIKAAECRASMIEVPVTVLPRTDGHSKVSPTLASALRCGRVMLQTIFSLYLTRASREQDARCNLPIHQAAHRAHSAQQDG
jgi:glycosyltransferase involved in cell wall biosynthesis